MRRRWPGLGSPPLIVQLVALLIGALVAAQAVTLLLTLVLPPAPPHRYALTDIAEALRADGPGDPASGFDRTIQSGPPDLSARGWFVSANAHSRLAKMMRRPLQDVALGFYTQLPVGGIVEAVAPPRRLPDDAQVPVRHDDAADASGSTGVAIPIDLTQFDVGGGAAGDGSPRVIHAAMIQQMPGGPPGGGFPGGGFPGGGFPGGGQNGNGFPHSTEPSSRPPRSDAEQRRAPQGDPSSRDAPRSRDRTDAPRSGAPDDGRAPDGMMPAPASRPSTFDGRPPAMAGPPIAFDRSTLPTIPRALPSPVERAARVPEEAAPATRGAERAADSAPVATTAPADSAPTPVATEAAIGAAVGAPVASPGATVSATGRPVPIARAATGLLGLAPAPFVEGDFVAGVRRIDGRWLVVSPRAEGFPNAWQRRVALWFLLSLLAVAPVAWLFIRRIVGPLNDFVHAAELLGRDPGAAILPLDGPAEIGRAAHAFNQMRGRLRSFVDDRTAMIGAISHDLRTPLTRLRFRIEDVPDDQQDGLRHDVGEMEAMIASVIAFLRDASIPAARERRDLAGIVEDVIEDANLLGTVEAGGVESAIVDVDALGVRRVLNNLLTNALKYGGGYARVALTVDQGCAVADIVDKGPGVPDGELDRIFEPFYRSEAARGSNREGSGLGLAVCRSIARAHGGDVVLFRSQQGFTARVILPLAFLQGRSAG